MQKQKRKKEKFKILIQPNFFPVYFVLIVFIFYVGYIWFFMKAYLLHAIVLYYVIGNLILYRVLKKNENFIVFTDYDLEIIYKEKKINKEDVMYFSKAMIYLALNQKLYKIVENMSVDEKKKSTEQIVLYLNNDKNKLSDEPVFIKGMKYYPVIININPKDYSRIRNKMKELGIEEINKDNLHIYLR